MSETPLNLGLRFLLEIAGLVAIGYWGWVTHAGFGRVLWTVVPVVAAATVWAVFRVPGDGGAPIVTVAGWVRLLIEAAYFGGAVAALEAAGRRNIAIALAAIVVAHYAISYDRVVRFLRGA